MEASPVALMPPPVVISVVFAPKALAIYHPICLEHRVPEDLAVELPRRLEVAMAAIDAVARDYPELLQVEKRPQPVEGKWVRAVHDPTYILRMSQKIATAKELPLHVTQTTQEEELEDQSGVYKDTFASERSWDAALHAAGAVCLAVDRLSAPGSQLRTAICAVRPPGHHCGRAGRTDDVKSQGFCFLNNVAIGVKYANLKHNYKRIAVVDFDCHHGNGTEELLRDDPDFFFASIHAVGEHFYPGTGNVSTSANVLIIKRNFIFADIPLRRGSASSAFRAGCQRISDAIKGFQPDLFFFSAGFDGHKHDPVCGPPHGDGLQLATDDFVYITAEMMRILKPDTRIISVMEGGYDVSEATNALGKCFDAHLRTLLGLEWSRAATTSPKRIRVRISNEDADVDIMGDCDDGKMQIPKKRRARSKSPQPVAAGTTSPSRRRARSRSPSPKSKPKKRSPSPELVRANSSFI